jgi:thiol:disulfide interchange protein DsbD
MAATEGSRRYDGGMAFLSRGWAVLWVLLVGSVASAQPWLGLAEVEARLNHDRLQPGMQAVIAVVLDVEPGYKAQSNSPLDELLIPTTVRLEPTPGVTVYESIYPPGQEKTFPALGTLSIYEGRTVIYVPVEVGGDAAAGPIVLRGTMTLQICDDQQCFAPMDKTFEVATEIVASGQTVSAVNGELFANFDPRVWGTLKPAGEAPARPSGAFNAFGVDLQNTGVLGVMGIAFVVGILLNIMPCVLPVLPIKALGFYEAAKQKRLKCFMLGVVFCLGVIATFAALAIPILVLGAESRLNWGEMFSNVYFAGAITLILIAAALGTFGVFEFILPTKVYAFSPRHDTYTGNFLWGILTAVLSTPCTFGAFAALLAVALKQPAVVGTILLTSVGAGMAFPYLLLSAFPGWAKNLPAGGKIANVVKQSMSFLLLATAIFFAGPLLPGWVSDDLKWWVIFAVVAFAGAYLIVRVGLIAPRPQPIAFATVTAGVMVGIALWVVLLFTRSAGDWTPYSSETLARSIETGNPVVVKFTADWCTNCKVVESVVFGDEQTQAQLNDVGAILIKVDLTASDAPGWPLLTGLNPAGSIPFTAVYLGGSQTPQTLNGIYASADLLEKVLAGR